LKNAFGKRRVALCVLAACFALSVLFVQDASAQRRHKDPLACRDSQLSVRDIGGDAAMGGVRSIVYAFRNVSRTPCTLEGYPRIEVLNRSRRVVRRGQPRYSEMRPVSVTIEPGKTAVFSIYYNAGGAGRIGKPCPTYPKVRITAPDNRRGAVLRAEIQLCGEVEVLPVGPPPGVQP